MALQGFTTEGGDLAGAEQAPRGSWGAGDPALDEEQRRDSALFGRFLERRGRTRTPRAWVNERFLFTNSAASHLLRGDERDALWACAVAAIAAGVDDVRPFATNRAELCVACAAVEVAGVVVGAEVALSEGSATVRPARSAHRAIGWTSLRESEIGIARLVAEGLTNREVGARLFLSRHTVDFHLRQIYRKLGITSRVELTRLVLEHTGDDVPPWPPTVAAMAG